VHEILKKCDVNMVHNINRNKKLTFDKYLYYFFLSIARLSLNHFYVHASNYPSSSDLSMLIFVIIDDLYMYIYISASCPSNTDNSLPALHSFNKQSTYKYCMSFPCDVCKRGTHKYIKANFFKSLISCHCYIFLKKC